MRYICRIEKATSAQELAKKIKCSHKSLVEKNQLVSDQLYVGQCLVVEQTNGKEYVVQPFDTIATVAKKFGVSEEKLREENGGDIFLGQNIIIPF
ncbi:MAG: LysM peptidoglycan-binding domain-containing protein [Clostridia bacterium]